MPGLAVYAALAGRSVAFGGGDRMASLLMSGGKLGEQGLKLLGRVARQAAEGGRMAAEKFVRRRAAVWQAPVRARRRVLPSWIRRPFTTL